MACGSNRQVPARRSCSTRLVRWLLPELSPAAQVSHRNVKHALLLARKSQIWPIADRTRWDWLALVDVKGWGVKIAREQCWQDWRAILHAAEPHWRNLPNRISRRRRVAGARTVLARRTLWHAPATHQPVQRSHPALTHSRPRSLAHSLPRLLSHHSLALGISLPGLLLFWGGGRSIPFATHVPFSLPGWYPFVVLSHPHRPFSDRLISSDVPAGQSERLPDPTGLPACLSVCLPACLPASTVHSRALPSLNFGQDILGLAGPILLLTGFRAPYINTPRVPIHIGSPVGHPWRGLGCPAALSMDEQSTPVLLSIAADLWGVTMARS